MCIARFVLHFLFFAFLNIPLNIAVEIVRISILSLNTPFHIAAQIMRFLLFPSLNVAFDTAAKKRAFFILSCLNPIRWGSGQNLLLDVFLMPFKSDFT